MAYRLSKLYRFFSGAANPVTKLGDEYDFIIVGAGATGCALAARLCDAGRTLIVDRAAEPDRAEYWEMPCAPTWHRTQGRFGKSTSVRVAADMATMTATLKRVAAGEEVKSNQFIELCASRKGDMVGLLSPDVVGGSGVVLGSRTWIRGHNNDWRDFPIVLDEIVEHYKKIENAKSVCNIEKDFHRSGSGTVSMSKLLVNNPLYKLVLEAAQKEGMLMIGSSFNERGGFRTAGFARAETMVCSSSRIGFTSLGAVKESIKFHKPLTLLSGPEVKSITLAGEENGTVEPGNAGRARKVKLQNLKSGEERSIVCNRAVFLCAGALKTPELIMHSAGLSHQLGADKMALVGANLWAVPTATIQFKTTKAVSLAPAAFALIRGLNWFEWTYNVHKNGWCNSNFDDLVGFICRGASGPSSSSEEQSSAYPNIRIRFQPFMTNNKGAVIACHGCQFVVSLARPVSRGSVKATSDGCTEIDTGAFSAEEDLEALRAAVEFVHKLAASMGPTEILSATNLSDPMHCPDVRIEFDGPVGGTLPLGSLVDPLNMRLVGTTNIHVCDGSIIPRPLLADAVPLAMSLARRCADQFVVDEQPHTSSDDLLYNTNLGAYNPKDQPIYKG